LNSEERRFIVPEAKKVPKTKVSRPKVARAKPSSTVKKVFAAKPKAAIKAPKAVKAAKGPTPEVIAPVKVRKLRGPRRAKGTFADLLKKQAELEIIKKGAKAELKKQYDGLLKEAESIKFQYKGLFDEAIESAPAVRGTRAKKATGKVPGLKPFSLKEVEAFVEQKQHGIANIKIQGRRPKSISRIEDAYRHSEDAEEILKMLNK
jgi:hypothetical protein